ncbi:hypothetical protein [Niabella hirudinis]|uniref:hypothetical protein n=1 Tax=Niabella hirudinis TaxID=1285929 RepID=UPI003EBEEBAF
MEALRIEILNPKALKLIKGMQELDLIRVRSEPATKLKSYLKEMRRKAQSAPDLDEITAIVEDIREARHAKK